MGGVSALLVVCEPRLMVVLPATLSLTYTEHQPIHTPHQAPAIDWAHYQGQIEAPGFVDFLKVGPFAAFVGVGV